MMTLHDGLMLMALFVLNIAPMALVVFVIRDIVKNTKK